MTSSSDATRVVLSPSEAPLNGSVVRDIRLDAERLLVEVLLPSDQEHFVRVDHSLYVPEATVVFEGVESLESTRLRAEIAWLFVTPIFYRTVRDLLTDWEKKTESWKVGGITYAELGYVLALGDEQYFILPTNCFVMLTRW